MVTVISFSIPIRPKPTPRPRVKAGQKGAYYPTNYQAYKDQLEWLIKKAWVEQGKPKVDLPIRINVSFELDRINIDLMLSDCERDGLRGDVDNYFKGVADALETVGVIDNDRDITEAYLGFTDRYLHRV